MKILEQRFDINNNLIHEIYCIGKIKYSKVICYNELGIKSSEWIISSSKKINLLIKDYDIFNGVLKRVWSKAISNFNFGTSIILFYGN